MSSVKLFKILGVVDSIGSKSKSGSSQIALSLYIFVVGCIVVLGILLIIGRIEGNVITVGN
jgi:hypothetical protein